MTIVERSSALLAARTSRRGFLVRAAVAGTAMVVAPWRFLLQPVTAYAAVCGCADSDCDCDAACCDGYTAFCCEVNGGANVCPAGTFPGGWWRADGSMFCGGTRYLVDCNLSCDADWPACTCAQGDCNRRGTACNLFRYGQCNQDIDCYGPIVCRMATCEPPYTLDLGCTDESFSDDFTANHTADCISSGEAAPATQPGSQPTAVQDDRDNRAADREAEVAAREQERANRHNGDNGGGDNGDDGGG